MNRSQWGPELPWNLLDKLFFFVRTPEEGFELDDFQWCAADAVSTYRRGWDELAAAGYVKMEMAEDAETSRLTLAVKFTDMGLTEALNRNVSQKVRDLAVTAEEERAVVEQREQYESNPLFGSL